MKKVWLKEFSLLTEDGKRIPAAVPGDITSDLLNAGLIPDPLYGENLKTLGSLFESDYTYECEISVSEDLLSYAYIALDFGGIDTISEVFLNGKKLGSTENMFLAYSFDVKDLLRKGKNLLQVKIFSSLHYARSHDDGNDYKELFSRERIFLRKAQCHFGWDWAPRLPGAGIWLPVSLSAYNAKIADVHIKTDVSGHISFSVCAAGDTEGARADVSICGKTYRAEMKGGYAFLETTVNDAQLWWPNGYGKQPLYEYSVKLLDGEGHTADEKCGHFAFRSVELIQEPIDGGRYSFYLCVNGKKIFCKGSNWVPISNMTGSIPGGTYERLLYLAKEGNFNILRVWGGGIYEKEIFYDLCDRFGILVWQDFMLSCSQVPTAVKGFEKSFLEESAYQIKRLRNRPSLALWCGGNEMHLGPCGAGADADALLKDKLKTLVEESDEGRPYIYSSPYSLIGEDEWLPTSGDCHFSSFDLTIKQNAFDDFRKVIAMRPAQFISESAVLGCSRIRSLRRFIPKQDMAAPNECWDYHFVKNPYSKNCPDTFLQKEKRYAELFFGDILSVQDFVKKSMLAHMEILNSESAFAISNADCGGFMNWMYNDNWGCGTWALIDYYGECKPAYYAMKRNFRKLCAFINRVEKGFNAVLVNDTEKDVTGELVCKLKTLCGQTIDEKLFRVAVKKGHVWGVPLYLEGEGDYMTAEFIGEESAEKYIFFHRQWKGKHFVSDIRWSVADVSANECRVELFAENFARSVFLDCPDNSRIVYSDNYFDMEKGDARTIYIRSDIPVDKNFISVKTFADEWPE